jgi:hypothetical protein
MFDSEIDQNKKLSDEQDELEDDIEDAGSKLYPFEYCLQIV